MADKSEDAKVRANARFEKTQKQSRDGDIVRAQYEAAGNALRERTARLKSLRLAKEAAEALELENNPPVKAAPAKVKKLAAVKKPVAAKAPRMAKPVMADAVDDDG